jgi:hypothetical protein
LDGLDRLYSGDLFDARWFIPQVPRHEISSANERATGRYSCAGGCQPESVDEV